MEEGKVKKVVREGYAKIAKREGPCCSPRTSKKNRIPRRRVEICSRWR